MTAQKTDVAIQQINLSYNGQQDRMLMRVGLNDNTELLVWLTCRIAKSIWQLLSCETNIPTANSIEPDTPVEQAVAQFKQEMQVAETLQKMDFATQYQPRPAIVKDGAMLAINVLLITVDAKPPSLEMPCLEGITVRMNLTPELTLAICNMLQLSAKEAGWQLASNVIVQMPMVMNTEIKKVLH